MRTTNTTTAEALTSDNRYNARFVLPKLNEYYLGQLMYFLMLSVAYEGNAKYTSFSGRRHGSYLSMEYETDSNDVFYVRIDKNRKIPITSFIRAIGVETDAEIIEMFGEDERILATLDKDPSKTVEEALIEIYKKLRPGEPPTVDSSRSLLNALFFDTRRYDISAVGRYKYNKKLNIARRLAGHKLCETVTDPMTGEVIAEEGTVCTRELANEIARRGVHGTIIEANDGTKVKVFGNGMVDMKDFVSFDPQEKCGINRFEDGAVVGIDELVASGIIKKVEPYGLKVLGNGELEKKLTIKANKFTASAVQKIEKAGGTVEVL